MCHGLLEGPGGVSYWFCKVRQGHQTALEHDPALTSTHRVTMEPQGGGGDLFGKIQALCFTHAGLGSIANLKVGQNLNLICTQI